MTAFRKYLLVVILIISGFELFAQSQPGYVLQKGTKSPLSGVIVKVKGANAILTDSNGKFLITLDGYSEGQGFSFDFIKKSGYVLLDPWVTERKYPYSNTVPVEIVMLQKQVLEKKTKVINDDINKSNPVDSSERSYFFSELLAKIDGLPFSKEDLIIIDRIKNGEFKEAESLLLSLLDERSKNIVDVMFSDLDELFIPINEANARHAKSMYTDAAELLTTPEYLELAIGDSQVMRQYFSAKDVSERFKLSITNALSPFEESFRHYQNNVRGENSDECYYILSRGQLESVGGEIASDTIINSINGIPLHKLWMTTMGETQDMNELIFNLNYLVQEDYIVKYVIPEGVKNVKLSSSAGAFTKSIVFPSSIRVINGLPSSKVLESLYFFSAEPPTFNGDNGQDLNQYSQDIHIYVPEESIDIYKHAEGFWSRKNFIYPIPTDWSHRLELLSRKESVMTHSFSISFDKQIPEGADVILFHTTSKYYDRPYASQCLEDRVIDNTGRRVFYAVDGFAPTRLGKQIDACYMSGGIAEIGPCPVLILSPDCRGFIINKDSREVYVTSLTPHRIIIRGEKYINNDFKVYVPDKSYEAYMNSPFWESLRSYLNPIERIEVGKILGIFDPSLAPVITFNEVKQETPKEEIDISDTSVHFIDLGLPSGTLWADRNIGADTAEQRGNVYAWGEVDTKSEYTEANYKFYKMLHMADDYTIKKYGGDIDRLTRLEPEDDVATVLLGDSCHTPTEKEFEELFKYCDIKEYHINWDDGKVGYILTGPNGSQISMPHARYWTSDRDTLFINYKYDYASSAFSAEVNKNYTCNNYDQKYFYPRYRPASVRACKSK